MVYIYLWSVSHDCGPLAQSVERVTVNHKAIGSKPIWTGTFSLHFAFVFEQECATFLKQVHAATYKADQKENEPVHENKREHEIRFVAFNDLCRVLDQLMKELTF